MNILILYIVIAITYAIFMHVIIQYNLSGYKGSKPGFIDSLIAGLMWPISLLWVIKTVLK